MPGSQAPSNHSPTALRAAAMLRSSYTGANTYRNGCRAERLPGACSQPSRAARSSLHDLRVRLALGRPDHLADEVPQQARLAGPVLVHLVGVGGQHLVDEAGDGGLIAALEPDPARR